MIDEVGTFERDDNLVGREKVRDGAVKAQLHTLQRPTQGNTINANDNAMLLVSTFSSSFPNVTSSSRKITSVVDTDPDPQGSASFW